MALPRTRRLDRASFKEVSVRGVVRHSPLFSLRFVKNRTASSRFSVVVSSKVARKAVERNRIRRRAYETIRLSPLKEGYAAILYIKKEGAGRSASDFRNRLEGFLREALS